MKRGTGQGDILIHIILNFYGLQMNRIKLLQNILIYSYARRYYIQISMYIDIHIDKRMRLSPCMRMHDDRRLR